MKFAEIVICPLSAFGTPLKGDTIFGHFCWQLAYDSSLIKGGFPNWLDVYEEEPFVVFSSAFPRLLRGGKVTWLLPRPALPLHFFGKEEGDCFEALAHRKEKKSKKWMLMNEGEKIDLQKAELLNDKEICGLILDTFSPEEKAAFIEKPRNFQLFQSQPHNSINRLTFTTGEGFAPYQVENIWSLPGLKFAIFALFLEEALDLEKLRVAFERMGKMGFGRDASSGLGRFSVGIVRELPLPEKAKDLYTLGPFVPRKEEGRTFWYRPFVRFGKHGGYLALSENPFKEPVLMADEGAVIKSEAPLGPYIGRAVRNISKALPETVIQGYAIVLPFSWGGQP